MKKNQIILGAILISALATGLQSCQKQDPSIKNSDSETAVDNTTSASQRMWTTGKQLYAVGHNSTGGAILYTLTPPPIGGLAPTAVGGFFVSGQPVTNVTGIAYTTGSIIISTGSTSTFPNKLLTYNATGPYTAPTAVPCASITDIEYNEYDSKLYGILTNNKIVQISTTTGVTTLNLAPVVGVNQIRGLCNYNGLLSYSINDNTVATDNFYSYNPSSPTITAPLFSTDWGLGNGGMQYCNTFGWVIVSNTASTKKTVDGTTFAVSGPLTMGGSFLFTDLTSN
jgi:hypothetical protein